MASLAGVASLELARAVGGCAIESGSYQRGLASRANHRDGTVSLPWNRAMRLKNPRLYPNTEGWLDSEP